jgi:hypothetical protein
MSASPSRLIASTQSNRESGISLLSRFSSFIILGKVDLVILVILVIIFLA